MSNRRDFFLAGASAGAGLLATTPLGAAAKSRAHGGLPSAEQFLALVGASFVARDGERQRALTLEAVHAGEAKSSLRPVSLVLRAPGPVRGAHRGALVDLQHASTGNFSLRIEASGRDAQGALFRAEILYRA